MAACMFITQKKCLIELQLENGIGNKSLHLMDWFWITDTAKEFPHNYQHLQLCHWYNGLFDGRYFTLLIWTK